MLQRTTTLVDGAKDIEMTVSYSVYRDLRSSPRLQRDRFVRSILPIGALFSGSLILSNYAYLTLSVPFIQMLKVSSFGFFKFHELIGVQAFNPVAILLISFAFKIQDPNARLMLIVFVSC